MTTSRAIAISLSALSLLALCACGGGNVTLDNPRTSEGVRIILDGSNVYHLDPGETKQVSMGAGSHKVVIQGEKSGTIQDTSITVKEGGIVHSGGTGYVVWRQLYGLQNDRKTLLNEDWAMIDSIKFFGDFKVYPANVIYLEKNWTIGLEDKLPESQTLYVTKDYSVESKVFREDEFMETYREMSEKSQKQQ
jgi:hypothetical protein